MIFLKGIVGGLITLIAAWIVILIVKYCLTALELRRQGPSGLYAVAGGWDYLLQLPLVLILLSAAFGTGFYVAVRLTLSR